MNTSFSKIRHIQEANMKLENRLIKEDDMFSKEKSSTIEELIDKYVNMVEEDDYGFSDEFEFADNIISWVVEDLINNDFENNDYDEIQELVKDNFGEYILSQYTDFEDFGDFDDEDFDDEMMENNSYSGDKLKDAYSTLGDDEDISLSDETGTLYGEKVSRKEYLEKMLRKAVNNEDWNMVSRAISYLNSKM